MKIIKPNKAVANMEILVDITTQLLLEAIVFLCAWVIYKSWVFVTNRVWGVGGREDGIGGDYKP
jgi:hypothetical protein